MSSLTYSFHRFLGQSFRPSKFILITFFRTCVFFLIYTSKFFLPLVPLLNCLQNSFISYPFHFVNDVSSYTRHVIHKILISAKYNCFLSIFLAVNTQINTDPLLNPRPVTIWLTLVDSPSNVPVCFTVTLSWQSEGAAIVRKR